MKFIKNQKLKITLAIFVAFLTVQIIIKNEVFIGESPLINPSFTTRLINMPGNFIASVGSLFHPNPSQEFFSKLPKANPPATAIFKSISKSVMAAEDPSTNTKYIKILNGTKVLVQTVTLSDGRTITVITPLSQ